MTASNSLLAPEAATTPPHDSTGQGNGGQATGVVSRAWLHAFATETRARTLTVLDTVNTCVLTTRIGLRVLDRVGIPARPVPVFVTVHNMEAWHLASERVPVSQWPATAHSVGVDEHTSATPTRGHWNGHLVLLVKQPDQPRLLIDLTADQFDRPIRNLTVGGPVFMDIPADKPWTPQDPLFTTIGGRAEPDAIVSYRPMPPGHPEAKRWKTSPDWFTQPEIVDAMADAILARLSPPGDAIPQTGRS